MASLTLARFAVFFTLASLLICGLTYFLLIKRLKLGLQHRIWLKASLIFIAVLMTLAPIHYRLFHPQPERTLSTGIQFTQYFLLGWVGVILFFFLSAEILHAFLLLFRMPFQAEKRIFLTEGLARGLLTTASLATLGGLIEAEAGPKIEPLTIFLKTLPPEFDRLTLVQISDIHVGPLLHQNFLIHVVDQIMGLKPDLILITGDLVDGSVAQLKEQLEPLRKLSAPEGIYFCTGNHEYYSGVNEWIAHLESLGIVVFKNSNHVITRKTISGSDAHLLLAGVHDWHAQRYSDTPPSDPYQAAKTEVDARCKILLAHNPFSIQAAADAGFHLQLSGHTHAGQFYPFSFLVKLFLKHVEGHYIINENTQLYVNRGTGFWGPPNRLGNRAEITHLTLRTG